MRIASFAPLARQSLADAVYRQLSQRILRDDLAAGDELPSERVLAEQLGINRGAVREGLKRLQQAALVSVRHGGATQVLDWRAEAGLELLPQLLLDAGGQINHDAVRGVMLLRSTLAPAIARAAARKPDPLLAQRLDQYCRLLIDADSAEQRQRQALAFWAVLVQGSENIAFRLAFNSMQRTYRQVQELLTRLLDVEFRDHANLSGIVRAVREGDACAAGEHAAAHVALGENAILAVLQSIKPQEGI